MELEGWRVGQIDKHYLRSVFCKSIGVNLLAILEWELFSSIPKISMRDIREGLASLTRLYLWQEVRNLCSKIYSAIYYLLWS